MRLKAPHRGLTLVELIMVLVIIVVLIALIIPWINSQQRTPARRMQCGNNVKQLVLGIQNYYDTFLTNPYGARERTTPPDFDQASWGPSWLVATLPFCEQRPLYDKLVSCDNLAPANDFQSTAQRQQANRAIIKYLLCPSSTLPISERLSGFELVVPHYAGIMGANDDRGAASLDARDPLQRIVAGPFGGFAAGNGMLPVNESLTYADCVDGTANTISVGEVSDWYYNDAGRRLNPALSISNAGLGSKPAAGWIAGTDWADTIASGSAAIPADRILNLITVEHAVGINNRGGKTDPHPNWETQGIGRCGLNNPLTSAHPAGAMVGYVDGHVQLLTKQTSPFIVKRLAIRDDGAMIPEF